MKTRYAVMLLGISGAVAIACSSGPTSYAIDGTCGPLTIGNVGTLFTVAGPCTLGAAGDFAIAAALDAPLGGPPGPRPVSIDAGFVNSNGTLLSRFAGTADVPASLSDPIEIAGTFTFSGGTNIYADATGNATADGGVDLVGGSTSLKLLGSVSY
jgi:hypothetical protein